MINCKSISFPRTGIKITKAFMEAWYPMYWFNGVPAEYQFQMDYVEAI